MDSEKPALLEQSELTFWQLHRMSLLLIIVIGVSIVLTVVSVSIYTHSGAAQLDLSRPGYQAVSGKVEDTKGLEQYPSTGPTTPKTIQEFLAIFKKQSEKTRSVDAFSGDPLNPEVLIFGTSEELAE